MMMTTTSRLLTIIGLLAAVPHGNAAKSTKSKSKNGKSSTCAGSDLPPSFVDKDCGLFAALNEGQDVGSILPNTDLIDHCPCQGATVRLSNSTNVEEEVDVCTSFTRYGLRAYEQYCLENFDSVQDAAQGDFYKEAYEQYLQVVQEMALNPDDLTPEQRFAITESALEALPDPEYAQDCLAGCAWFVAQYCCGVTPTCQFDIDLDWSLQIGEGAFLSLMPSWTLESQLPPGVTGATVVTGVQVAVTPDASPTSRTLTQFTGVTYAPGETEVVEEMGSFDLYEPGDRTVVITLTATSVGSATDYDCTSTETFLIPIEEEPNV